MLPGAGFKAFKSPHNRPSSREIAHRQSMVVACRACGARVGERCTVRSSARPAWDPHRIRMADIGRWKRRSLNVRVTSRSIR
jgi:hypothetical protein